MILQPSYCRKKITTTKKNVDSIALGDFSIVSRESGRVKRSQLESLRFYLSRKFKKQAKV